MHLGSERSRHDYCFYLRNCGNENWMYIVLYVYDVLVLIASKDEETIENLKNKLSSMFQMSDFGYLERY